MYLVCERFLWCSCYRCRRWLYTLCLMEFDGMPSENQFKRVNLLKIFGWKVIGKVHVCCLYQCREMKTKWQSISKWIRKRKQQRNGKIGICLLKIAKAHMNNLFLVKHCQHRNGCGKRQWNGTSHWPLILAKDMPFMPFLHTLYLVHTACMRMRLCTKYRRHTNYSQFLRQHCITWLWRY